MEWVAEYDDGHAAHERDHGSLRNVPELDRVVRLRLGVHTLPIPGDATPLWLRRVSISLTTGEQEARTMMGWERDDDRVEVWVDGNGNLTEGQR